MSANGAPERSSWPWLRQRAAYRGQPLLPPDGRSTRYDRLNLIVRAHASGQNDVEWHIGLVYGDYPAPDTDLEHDDLLSSAQYNGVWTELATGRKVEALCGRDVWLRASAPPEIDPTNTYYGPEDWLVQTWRKEDAPATCGPCLNRLYEIPSLVEALDMNKPPARPGELRVVD
jgi:hypothetical protein